MHVTQPKLRNNSRTWILIGDYLRNIKVIAPSVSFASREKTLRRKSMVVTRIFFCFPASITSIINGVDMILGPVMGAFLKKLGFRVTAIVGCLSSSLGVTLGSFASTFHMLYITFSIPFALGQSLVFVSGAIIVNNYFDKRKSFALRLETSAQGPGTMILSPSL